jgi:hypothetical protein
MTNRFLAGIFALAFCFIIAFPAHAQDTTTQEKKGRPPQMRVISPGPAQNPITPEKKALIKELLGLMNAVNNSEAIANQFMGQLQTALAGLISNEMRGWVHAQKFAPAEQKRIEAMVDESVQRILTRIRAELPKRVNYSELAEKIGIETYNNHFTESEVKELIAFNKTPTAQKFVKILPQITAEIMPEVAKSIPPEPTQLVGELVEKITLETYNKHFTEAEVKELVAFNKTPTAQKFVRIRPQMIAEMMSLVEKSIAPELVPLINEIIDDELMKLTPKRK